MCLDFDFMISLGAKVLHSLGLAEALSSATEGNGIQTEGLNYYTHDGKVISQEARGLKAGNMPIIFVQFH